MLDRIEAIGEQIHSTTMMIDLIEGAAAKLLGQTPEARAAFTEAYLKKVIASADD